MIQKKFKIPNQMIAIQGRVYLTDHDIDRMMIPNTEPSATAEITVIIPPTRTTRRTPTNTCTIITLTSKITQTQTPKWTHQNNTLTNAFEIKQKLEKAYRTLFKSLVK